jgi:hypothetical protein
MALAAAIVTRFALRISFLFTTSFVGAYIMMFGVDCLARTGFIAGPQALLNRNPNHQVEYVLYKNVYVLLAMVIAIYLMSFAWQFVFNAAYQLGLHIVAAVEGKKAHEEFHHRDAGGEEEAAAGGGGGDPPASAPAHAASAHT